MFPNTLQEKEIKNVAFSQNDVKKASFDSYKMEISIGFATSGSLARLSQVLESFLTILTVMGFNVTGALIVEKK